MRLLWLFLRSRQSERAAIVLVAVGGAAWLWGEFLGFDDGLLAFGLVLFPLLAGTVPGSVTTSPFDDLERTTSRPLLDLRLIQTGVLLAIAGAALFAVTWSWQIDDAGERSVRNLAGFVGLSLLAAVLIGGRLAWIGPIIYGAGSIALVSNDDVYRMVLPLHPAGSSEALWISILVLACGLALATRCGARAESSSDTPW